MDQAQAVAPQRNKLVAGIAAVRDFLVDVRAEMFKVSWPTREELIDATRRVVIMTLAIGTVIGILDWLLQKIFINGIAVLTR